MENKLSSPPSPDNLDEASTNKMVDEEDEMLGEFKSVTGGWGTGDDERLCDDEAVMNESTEVESSSLVTVASRFVVSIVSDAESASTITENKKHLIFKVFHMLTYCYVRI